MVCAGAQEVEVGGDGSQVQPMFWVPPPLEVTTTPKLRWSGAASAASAGRVQFGADAGR